MNTHHPSLRSIFWIALAVRVAHWACLQAAPFSTYLVGDPARYDTWARQIAGGDWLGHEVFYQAPLYPYLLGVVYATVGDALWFIRGLQAVLGAFTAVLVAAATARMFDRRTGWIAGLVMATYAPALFFEGLLQKSSLDLFFVALGMWLLTWLATHERPLGWLALGATTAALALTRENALLAIPVLLLWAVVSRGIANGWPAVARERFVRCAAFGSGLAMLLFPVAARNAYVGGEWHLTTSQVGPNFYIGNHPAANGTYQPLVTGRGDARYEAADARRLAETDAGRPLSAGEVSTYYLRRSWEFISTQPVAWLQLLGRKTALAVQRDELVDTEDQYTVAHWSPVLWFTDLFANFGWVFPLALCGMWLSRREFRRLAWAYALIGVMLGTMVVFFVFGRYRLPVVPLLAPFAALTLERTWAWWGAARRGSIAPASSPWTRRRWGVPLILFLAAVAAARLPLSDRRAGRAVTLGNYGALALAYGDHEQAERFLQEALACQPRFLEARNNLGVLYRQRGDLVEAAACFQAALELAPDYATARDNLAALREDGWQPVASSGNAADLPPAPH